MYIEQFYDTRITRRTLHCVVETQSLQTKSTLLLNKCAVSEKVKHTSFNLLKEELMPHSLTQSGVFQSD